jgi:hypothetical protein
MREFGIPFMAKWQNNESRKSFITKAGKNKKHEKRNISISCFPDFVFSWLLFKWKMNFSLME